MADAVKLAKEVVEGHRLSEREAFSLWKCATLDLLNRRKPDKGTFQGPKDKPLQHNQREIRFLCGELRFLRAIGKAQGGKWKNTRSSVPARSVLTLKPP